MKPRWDIPAFTLVELLVVIAVIGILAVIAKQERVRLAERTRAGLERVRLSGKLGRPVAKADSAAIRALRASGASWSEIARQTGLARATCQKFAGKD